MPCAGSMSNFNFCVGKVKRESGYDQSTAEKVCGKIQSDIGKSGDIKSLISQVSAMKEKLAQLVESDKNVHEKTDKAVFDMYGEQVPDSEWTSLARRFKNLNQSSPVLHPKPSPDATPVRSVGYKPAFADMRAFKKFKMGKAMTAGECSTAGSRMMHPVADGHSGDIKNCEKKSVDDVKKADMDQTDPEGDPLAEKEIRNLRLKSKLSPTHTNKDLKEVKEVVQKDEEEDIKKEWKLDIAEMLASDREFSGTFHKPVIDKENDIIPATAIDKAMDDFMVLPMLQEVHTERPIGIITKVWRTNDDEYKFVGKVKPSADCDDVWKKIQKGEYDGLSIGGRRIKYSSDCSIPSSIRTTPCVTHRLKLYNVSVCSSPVNPEAVVESVAKAEDELVFDITETLIKAETTDCNLIHKTYDGVKKPMAENIDAGVSKSDDEVITKSDITELTKAIGDFSKAMEDFASHFETLTTAQPQKLSGKGHSVTSTFEKGDDPDPDEDPGKRVRKDEDPDPEPKKIRKAQDIESIQKAYDAKLAALEEKISKMESQVIQKGGTAVIIPQLIDKDDPVFSNLAIFDKMGKVAQ